MHLYLSIHGNQMACNALNGDHSTCMQIPNETPLCTPPKIAGAD
jgi:hypothetical protein